MNSPSVVALNHWRNMPFLLQWEKKLKKMRSGLAKNCIFLPFCDFPPCISLLNTYSPHTYHMRIVHFFLCLFGVSILSPRAGRLHRGGGLKRIFSRQSWAVGRSAWHGQRWWPHRRTESSVQQ